MFNRQSPRLHTWDYASSGMYFVTICTKDRERLFGHVSNGEMMLSTFGEIVSQCWYAIPDHFDHIQIIEFMVMPNHVHGVIEIVGARHASPVRPSLGDIVGSFKSAVTKRINAHRNTPGHPVWQRTYYDHIIRDDEDLNRIRQYILDNPAKWEEDEYNK